MQTSDIEILRIMKNNKSVRGSILKEGIQGLDRGEFIFVANDWTKVIAGKSVSIAKVIYLRNGRVTLELNIRKSPMVGCLKEEVVSGCYAGEDCITRCLQEVNIPEEVYFSKIIDCEKKNSKNL